jgi:hypothetical protein
VDGQDRVAVGARRLDPLMVTVVVAVTGEVPTAKAPEEAPPLTRIRVRCASGSADLTHR